MPTTVANTEANTEARADAVKVAVGVLVKEQSCLIARRPEHVHLGGYWEFPGGKCEPGESVEQSLRRELAEELGITVLSSSPMMEIQHDYGDKQVCLHVHKIDQFSGEPYSAEGQAVLWVAIEELANYTFPEANQPVIDCLLGGG